VTVLCDAFHDYPVMRYVLGPSNDYDRRLRTLIGVFVAARVLRQELVLGVHDERGSLAAVGLVTLPGERDAPEALLLRREAVWRELGAVERGMSCSGMLLSPTSWRPRPSSGRSRFCPRRLDFTLP
jgi:hypothetical protein